MEYIVENERAQTFLKVNGTFSSGLAFLKIFETDHEAHEFMEANSPHDEDVLVKPYTGFTS